MNISEGNQTQSDPLNHLFLSNLVLVSSSVINLILGLPTNVYVLWLIISGAGGTMASELSALNLAMTEILFCLFNVFDIVYLYLKTEPFRVVSTFALGFFNFGRPMFQTCICLERYLAVVHPVVFLRYKPLRYRMACSALVWVMVLGFNGVSIIFTPLDKQLFYICNALILVMFCVMLFCCLSVLRALKRPGPGEGERGREGGKAMKTRAFKIILIILLCTVIPQLPCIMIAYLRETMTFAHFYSGIVVCFACLVVTGFVNPLLYLHRAGKLPFLKGLL